ncbi:hypothetical protein [Streptomyces sp. ISL-100]|uniref:hypothetical protein n=1 Tax=Streptomyces sp. ISL-100 TaxID=2819173 RepID=UPI001BE91A4E|nr:hypothetical protein [Streptomyces sp. ISL-100]MBT2398724.1 hypothetical protein [Streptomyces sp. ISL-100]
MTRLPVRMCARCQQNTDAPVLVHEVHAATGPGFNVYACPECAEHYPPLTDALELLGSTPRRSRLTLRTYKVNTQGAVTEDSGKVVARSWRRETPAGWMSPWTPSACSPWARDASVSPC